jgi:uncharacterized membrane-anchored protein
VRSVIALAACAAVLVLVDVSIVAKERVLESGRVVYLEIGPVDPRSIMQGDYMALSFRIAGSLRQAAPRLSRGTEIFGRRERDTEDGKVVVALDSRSVASFRRLEDGKPLSTDEIALRYRVREGRVKFATNAFFFQEGTGKRYEGARYGEFRVGADGEVLLTGLRGKDLEPL